MKNCIILILSFALVSTSAFAQLKVVAPGDVGIGIDAPAEKLDIDGALKIGTTTNSNAGTIRYTGSDFEGRVGSSWKSLTSGGSGTGTGSGMWSDNSGTTTSDGDIQVNGLVTIKSNDYQSILNGDGSTRFSFATAPTTIGSTAAFGMWGNESHSTNPNPARAGELAFQVNYLRVGCGKPVGGWAQLDFEVKSNGDTYAYGDLYANGVMVASDARLKSNINVLSLGLNEVLKMSPKEYFYNGKASTNTTRKHVGLVAQELAEIIPEGVSTFRYDDDQNDVHEEYLAIDQSMLTYVLINAVKEQNELIEKQEDRISKLEKAIKLLLEDNNTNKKQ